MTQITETGKKWYLQNVTPAPSLVNCLCQMHALQFETGKVFLKKIAFTNTLMSDGHSKRWLRDQGFIHKVLVCLVPMCSTNWLSLMGHYDRYPLLSTYHVPKILLSLIQLP